MEKKNVLFGYRGKILTDFDFLRDIAVVDYREGQLKCTLELLKEFKPHVIAGIGLAKVAGPYALTGELMDACEHLEFIQVFGMGYDYIDVGAATERGIPVANVGGVGISSQSVAELAWAHIFALARRIPQVDAGMRTGELMSPARFGASAIEEDVMYFRGGPVLNGKTLGIIGLGKIGKRSALIGRLGLNMRVLAFDPYVEPADAEMLCVKLVGLDTLLKEADIVVIHAALTSENTALFGERELGLMKKTAMIVNVARGPIIDMAALAKALEEGKIYGAGIDAWPVEPPDTSAAWLQSIVRSNRTSLSCHVGSLHVALVERQKAGFENIARHCRGEKPFWVVNPSAYPAR
jgi:D-3-phosphoglycerate dehydrogenase / 2-oxoglutarate reductase